MFRKLPAFFIISLAFLFFVKPAFASTFSLSPGSGTVGIGSTLSVQVRMNTQGEPINAVSAYITYPADKLDVAFINYGGSFPLAVEGTSGSGTIRISRGNTSGGVNGSNISIATIGFKGKALGSAGIGFVGGSIAARASNSTDSLNLGASPGANITISSTAPVTAQAALPKISDLKVTEVGTDSATISWKTDKKTDSVVEYGIEVDKYLTDISKTGFVTDHSVLVSKIALAPGTKLHFRVVSKESSGNRAVSTDSTIQLKGYLVQIKLTNTNGDPLINTPLTLYSDPMDTTTNEVGEANFFDLTPGKHLVLVKGSGFEKSEQITVEANNNFDTAQVFPIQINPSLASESANKPGAFGLNPLHIAIGLSILIVLVVVIMIVLVKKNSRSGSIYTTLEPTPKTPTSEPPLFGGTQSEDSNQEIKAYRSGE